MTVWFDIEIAPKDGTWILGYFPDMKEVRQMRWKQKTGLTAHFMVFGEWTPFDPSKWTHLPTYEEQT